LRSRCRGLRATVRCLSLLLLGLLLGLPASVHAQDLPAQDSTVHESSPTLIDRYRAARFRVLSTQILRAGEPGLPTLPAARIPTPLDTLFAPAEKPAPEPSGFRITDRRVVLALERAWFDTTFADTEWAYLGQSRRFTFLDTTATRDLRARMQAAFGSPTETLGDFDLREPRDEYVQFEYRFIVNETLPVIVTDVTGPKGRGVIVSTEARHRDSLFALRRALLDTLRHAPRAPYVDYFYDAEAEQWYRTGFDGRSFFHTPISVSATTPQRRPVLDTTRAETESSTQPRSPPPRRNLPRPDR
jgi:hypothetical protein